MEQPEQQEEQLQPSGPPVPVEKTESTGFLVGMFVLELVIGGMILSAVLAPMGRTSGARRSTKLDWQQRQCEIDEAIRQQEAARGADVG